MSKEGLVVEQYLVLHLYTLVAIEQSSDQLTGGFVVTMGSIVMEVYLASIFPVPMDIPQRLWYSSAPLNLRSRSRPAEEQTGVSPK